jgi:predicted RNase H-like HicB family nuclease
MSLDELENLPWLTAVEPDVCDGQPCFVARNPELGSCIGQGLTVMEALDDLAEARRDLIGVMLEFGDTIPQPAQWNELTRIAPTIHLTVHADRPVPIPPPLATAALHVC